MKKISSLILSAFFLFSCEKEYVDGNPVTVQDHAVADAQSGFHAQAILSGDEEVPVRDTQARGVATFHLNKEGTELRYRIMVANIDNVVGVHIHKAPKGLNGSVVVGLFSELPGGGSFDGPLTEGVITDDDLTGSLADLVSLLQSGNAYVNVHTNDGVAPANTGPGDFASGEIRGQIKANKQ